MSANPSTLWLSEVDDFEGFEEGTKDANSFSLRLMTQNEIRWIGALDQLLVGTSGDVWLVTSNRIETPLTPTNFQSIRQVHIGSAKIQAIRVNDRLLFVDFVGRKIHELTISDNKYVAPDLCSLAEDITLGSITGLCHQKHPNSIIWATITDAEFILSFTYDRLQNITAWAKHPVSGTVMSACRIPGATEDEIWLSVMRIISSIETVFIERLAKMNFGTAIEDAYFVDCGITKIDATPFNTIDGLDHLNGETVDVLGDGVWYPGLLVDGGEVSLPDAEEVYKAQVGIPYVAAVQPMRIVMNTQGGTSAGSVMQTGELSVDLHNSYEVSVGPDSINQQSLDLADPKLENSSTITGLFSGNVPVHHDGGYTVQNPIIISSSAPFPLTVRSIVARTDKVGR